MKKIIKPKQQEDAVYYSDFNGESFGKFYPHVELKINFNYGSKYDCSNLELHLTDAEIEPILELIKLKLSNDKKNEFKKSAAYCDSQIESSMDSRDWYSADSYLTSKQLFDFLLDQD
jgi:hypothetical protein